MNGLDFTPNQVVLTRVVGSGSSDATILKVNSFLEYFGVENSRIASFGVPPTNAGFTNYLFRLDGTIAYVSSDGFRLPVSTTGATYKWEAWGE